MKTNKIYLVILAAFVVIFSSCLKDSLYDDGSIQAVKSSGNDKFVEIHLTSSDNSNTIIYGFPDVNKDTSVNFVPVQITSAEAAPEDIKVTFQLLTPQDAANDPVLDSLLHVEKYIIPTNNYTILNTNNTVIIPKGQRRAFIQVKLNPANYPAGSGYLLPFKLTGVSGGSYKLSNLVVGYAEYMRINKYDGLYSIKGYTLRAGDAARTGAFKPYKIELKSSGATSVTFGKLQRWADNSEVSVGYPKLTIDPATNLVNLSSDGGILNTVGYTSRYDSAKKTFYISYTWGAGPSSRLAVDTITYVGSRF